MSQRFSERFGIPGREPEIVIREDAPDNLRYAVAQIAEDVGLTPGQIRSAICGVLYVRPNPSNWSQYPNIWDEVQDLLSDCEWFKVYDIIEVLRGRLDPTAAEQFTTELNKFFRATGIGWELTDQGITFRGGETFASATATAIETLENTGKASAAREIHEALRDISRRPKPDVTGAIQHVIAALECTARDITGLPNETLGKLIPRLNLPKPLDIAVEKMWGYASDKARHIREGDSVEEKQAELVVSVACAVCAFIAKQDSH